MKSVSRIFGGEGTAPTLNNFPFKFEWDFSGNKFNDFFAKEPFSQIDVVWIPLLICTAGLTVRTCNYF